MPNNLYNTVYNPDVLSCIANLSSDEVFTPPTIANAMLDLLPQELFSDPNTTFLDPASKSGVFLREIAKRLLKGLEKQIPDLQERASHVFKKQIFGIAITELTSHLSRRSLYCSKTANGEYSVVDFDSEGGNVRFEAIEHTWKNGKCKFCGASKEKYNRGDDLESHAYEFIHVVKPEEIFKMKFDVIVSNPPYQLSTAGGDNGAQAKPIYQLFVEQAKKLNPKYITMIIPSRWFSGGWGLDKFRDDMITDNKVRELHDFIDSGDCFPGVQIKGGVCYFLWSSNEVGKCKVFTHAKETVSVYERYLKESGIDALLRFNQGVSIYHKIRALCEPSIVEIVSSQKPFGLGTAYHGEPQGASRSIKVYENGGVGYASKYEIPKGVELINKYKVYISAAYGAGEGFPHQILNKPFVGDRGSCCTETYIMLGPFKTKQEAENLCGYVKTRFFRSLVMMIKNSQHALKKVYSLVPMQDFSKPWTDEELYKKYKLTREEIDFIESMIKPMD